MFTHTLTPPLPPSNIVLQCFGQCFLGVSNSKVLKRHFRCARPAPLYHPDLPHLLFFARSSVVAFIVVVLDLPVLAVADLDKHVFDTKDFFHFGWKCSQALLHRWPFWKASLVVKAPVMLWAFDQVSCDQTVGKQCSAVRASSSSGIELAIIFRMIKHVRLPGIT